jgi:hypothetical protein
MFIVDSHPSVRDSDDSPVAFRRKATIDGGCETGDTLAGAIEFPILTKRI